MLRSFVSSARIVNGEVEDLGTYICVGILVSNLAKSRARQSDMIVTLSVTRKA